MLIVIKLSLFCAFLIGFACGRKPVFNDDSSKIIEGHIDRMGRYPYAVHYDAELNGKYYSCGGVIIHPEVVLTAAHCLLVDDYGQPMIKENHIKTLLAGSTRLDRIDWSMAVNASVRKIIVHEDWNQTYGYNDDLAIFLLQEPLPIRANIQPISLVDTIPSNEFVGQRVRLMGWGQISTWVADGSDKLRYVDMNVVARKTCFKKMLNFGIHAIFNKRKICYIGDTGKESHGSGDSGGPSIILGRTPADDRLIGIVSTSIYGDKRKMTELGIIHTLVPAFIDWINGKLREEGLCLNQGKVETCA